jgi:hypothetical protein
LLEKVLLQVIIEIRIFDGLLYFPLRTFRNEYEMDGMLATTAISNFTTEYPEAVA